MTSEIGMTGMAFANQTRKMFLQRYHHRSHSAALNINQSQCIKLHQETSKTNSKIRERYLALQRQFTSQEGKLATEINSDV